METNNNERDNLKNALCYIPLVAFVFYFTEKNRTKDFDAHIKHGMTIFLIFMLLRIVLWVFFQWFFVLVGWWLGGIITLLYLIISGVLFFKAYNGEDMNMGALDDFEEKMEDTINNKKDGK